MRSLKRLIRLINGKNRDESPTQVQTAPSPATTDTPLLAHTELLGRQPRNWRRGAALRVAMEQTLQPVNLPKPACAAPDTCPEESNRLQIEALLWAEAGSMAESALPPGLRTLESMVNRL